MPPSFLLLAAIAVGGQSPHVTVNELKTVWDATRIPRVKFEFERRIERFGETSTGPFGEQSPEKLEDTVDKGRFARDQDLGMYLSTSHRQTNLLDGRGVSIAPEAPGIDMSGMNSVKIEPEGETAIQRNATTIAFLHWVDPLATKLYSRIAAMNGSFEIRTDMHHGRVVDIVIPGRGQSQTVVLAEKVGWRVVELRVDVNGSPRIRSAYHYHLDSPLRLLKTEVQLFSPSTGELESATTTDVANVEFDCARADLELLPPVHSVVADRTGSSTVRYILRTDGSRRNYSNDERRLADSWDDLIRSEEGELFSRGTQRQLWPYLLGIGVVLTFVSSWVVLRKNRA